MVPSGQTIVTGATGFVGRHLLQALRARGDSPVAWQRQPHGGHPINESVHVVDVLDRDGVRRAIAESRPARIFHLAGAPHVGDSWKNSLPTLQVNVLGTHHLLEAVRHEHPTCRVLVVTSGMIYKPGPEALDEDAALVPSSPYGLSKLAQDQLARLTVGEDGLNVVVARPFNHIGPGQDPSFAIASFCRQIALIEHGMMAPDLRVGNLDARRDLTDVRDVVAAYLRIMDDATAGSAWNVCSGTANRIGDLLNTLLGLASVPITTSTDPDRMRPSDTPLLLGSHARLTAALGWTPTIPIEVTLADTLAWWRTEVTR